MASPPPTSPTLSRTPSRTRFVELLNAVETWDRFVQARPPYQVALDLAKMANSLIVRMVGVPGSPVSPRKVFEDTTGMALTGVVDRSIPFLEDKQQAVFATPEWASFVKATAELQGVDLMELSSTEEKTAFFINLYNVMSFHAHLVNSPSKGSTTSMSSLYKFQRKSKYIVGALGRVSIFEIEHCILRGKSVCPIPPPSETLLKSSANKKLVRWADNDHRLSFVPEKSIATSVLSFVLCNGAKSSPSFGIYTREGLMTEVQAAVSIELLADVRLKGDKILLPKVLYWFKKDMGATKIEMLEFLAENVALGPLKSKLTNLVDDTKAKRCSTKYSGYHWDILYFTKKSDVLRESMRNNAFGRLKQSTRGQLKDQLAVGSLQFGKISMMKRRSLPLAYQELDFATIRTPIESNLHQKLPQIRIAPLSDSTKQLPEIVFTLSGPSNESDGSVEEYGDFACGSSISTYPVKTAKNGRQGDPICDRFALTFYHNRAVVVLSDGCNWGIRPRNAAVRANNAFIETIALHPHLQDLQQLGKLLLMAMTAAHAAITENESISDVGTTTLLGGVLVEAVDTEEDEPKWAFICVSVGDCKVYLWSHKRKSILDITANNRGGLDVTDPGGRLGPSNEQGWGDFRNLNVIVQGCDEGDTIIVVSDGVHDNFMPQYLAQTPQDIGSTAATWKTMSPKDYSKSHRAAIRFMEQSILSSEGDAEPTPKELVTRMIAHSFNNTNRSRGFLEANANKRVPDNLIDFPGKMDHTTCVVFRVGPPPSGLMPRTSSVKMEGFPLVMLPSLDDIVKKVEAEQKETVEELKKSPSYEKFLEAQLSSSKFIILLFFRGPYDPFCRGYLRAWSSISPFVGEHGGKIFGIAAIDQSLADETRSSWMLRFPLLGSREEAVKLAKSYHVLVAPHTPREGPALQSGIIVKTATGVIYEWQSIPTSANFWGAVSRPHPQDLVHWITLALAATDSPRARPKAEIRLGSPIRFQDTI